ncbi:PREDICTED: uncharacterized protein LOC105449547 [Wasmannia auropunctata]|uniref:uncharacterized protein LOC105449547 n=1 Tax=Wasmannia auropunctata TaxID=64793 RepID=UPI0005EF7CF8|nr:PREDICTED: uncharacterized protein LOC105449547 [Wasmannia auropunctata]
MTNILNIEGEPIFDDSIVKIETHTYNLYVNTSFKHSDEIRIPIQQQDLYTLPYESSLYVEGRLTLNKRNENTTAILGNNCVAFMFDEIRYELNDVEIDRNRNVGLTTTLKNYVLLSLNNAIIVKHNAGFLSPNDSADDCNFTTADGHFSFCVPLNMLFGFCEDYRRVIINARHKLILIQVHNDNNYLAGDPATKPKLELFKIQWRMLHITLNDINKLSMQALESGRYLNMSFRSWDLYEYPLLPSTTKHSWTVKIATQLEKPRYVIFAIQTDKKNNMKAVKTVFDNCKLTNIKLYLNSEFDPYDNLNLDFDKNRAAILHDMFARFRTSYY